jgi:plasmid stability protein
VVPKWLYNETVAKTVTLSVKHVPADLANRLKERARRNNRSLQGELLAILDEAGTGQLTLSELSAIARQLGLKGKAGESARIIREERDARSR